MKIIKLKRACIVFGVTLVTTVVLACSPSYEDKSGEFSVMPEELKDCKIFRVQGTVQHLYITKCPHADTTTSTTGKHKTHSSLTYGE